MEDKMLSTNFKELPHSWYLVYVNMKSGLCFLRLMAQDFDSAKDAKEEMKREWKKLEQDEENRNPALLFVPKIKQEIL